MVASIQRITGMRFFGERGHRHHRARRRRKDRAQSDAGARGLGFNEESDRDYWKSYRHLLRYDPDQVQLLYATPHRWIPFYESVQDREVLQSDLRLWDYKHQVLNARNVPAWRVFLWFKGIEVLMQARPKVLRRMQFDRNPDYRHAMR